MCHEDDDLVHTNSREMKELDLQELPPLVYQLLLLSTRVLLRFKCCFLPSIRGKKDSL